MFKNLGQVMVYVKNLDAAKAFWTEKSGFSLIDDQIEGDIRWIEIAPTKESETSIVLHDKAVIAKMSPELNLGTPSLMFITDDVEGLYQEFKNKQITVGDLVEMPTGKVFNFAD
ncbi:MAG TPA: VOC family protein, partial [Aliicoccus persicus]|nr:VOC family protein [Aliicoccus persicus]